MNEKTHLSRVSQQETVLDGVASHPSSNVDPDRERLIENYHAIIRERAIRYPVTYHFVRELGKGRQGIVFLAIRQGGRGCLTRHAVKIHDPAIYSTAEQYWTDMGRLAGQVSKLQPIHNDHLVTREYYDECNGVGYLQMAAIDGLDLQFLLEGTHLAIARSQSTDEEWKHFLSVLFRIENDRFMLQPGLAVYILRKVLLGLSCVHEAGFLHADIKPSNIMIDRMGSVKLVDFGRAVTIGERISILLGSPFYMAPETHRLEAGQVPSDLYSAGVVGLEMLTGRYLEDCCDMNDEQLLDFKMKLVDSLDQRLPPHVRAIPSLVKALRRFLQPDPAARYQTAKDADAPREGLSAAARALRLAGMEAEYDRELRLYLEKITDPETGHVNPRLR